MEDTENLKTNINEIPLDQDSKLVNTIKNFNELSKRHNEQKASNCELLEYQFNHEEPSIFQRYLTSVTDLKTKLKIINLSSPKTNNLQRSTFDRDRSNRPNSNLVNSYDFSPNRLRDNDRQHDFAFTENRYDNFDKKYQNDPLNDRDNDANLLKMELNRLNFGVKNSLDNNRFSQNKNPKIGSSK